MLLDKTANDKKKRCRQKGIAKRKKTDSYSPTEHHLYSYLFIFGFAAIWLNLKEEKCEKKPSYANV